MSGSRNFDVQRSASAAAVDAANPWLGLASFTEETRAFFHGRDEEVGELSRRVQRKLLTVLFGQSGLGKTSILRAGVVPRLRTEGFCPVYVRLDYGRESPPPSEQIKQAVLRATVAAGQWTRPGIAEQGESLWEFLHHRDDTLRDPGGRALIPLLIFDQFEEIFTLAQGDDFGRQRAAQFQEDLADLVENRPPKALEAKLEHDDTAAERFDFARADYRILIALREDYLAHLEGTKAQMPSVTQNRMRLARMNGMQALAAVTGPGGRLVSDEVARAIVRFVAGGAELERAEVEPSLLSLVCRELNNARLAQGRAEISADLLAGSRETILSEFYERALADQPSGVRAFIEDELLTDSGYRESIAEERVKKGFAAAGATPEALAALVDRRLLRVEERLDVRRVELTHDVLCGVVAASRQARHEREARARAERQLADTREKEAATRQALWRARRVAAICAVLALGAAASAVFGYLNYRRARSAEAAAVGAAREIRTAAARAEATEELAQQSRGEAEKLVTFLIEDFYNELEPVGRLDVVSELARRTIDYYRRLPLELRTPQTVRNHMLATTRLGASLAIQGKSDEAGPMLDEAARTFERLHANGDRSEELIIGWAIALRSHARVLHSQAQFEQALVKTQRAVELTGPLATTTGASRRLRVEYAEDMMRHGFQLTTGGRHAEAIIVLREAREIFAALGGADLSDLRSAAALADVACWLGQAMTSSASPSAETEAVLREGIARGEKVLERNPADRRAMRGMSICQSYLGRTLGDAGRLTEALPFVAAAVESNLRLLQLDPSNNIERFNLTVKQSTLAQGLWRAGDFDGAIRAAQASIDTMPGVEMGAMRAFSAAFTGYTMAALEIQRGNRAGVDHAFTVVDRYLKLGSQGMASESARPAIFQEMARAQRGVSVFHSESASKGLAEQQAALARLRAIKAATPTEKRNWTFAVGTIARDLAWCQLEAKNPAAVAAVAQEAIRVLRSDTLRGSDQRDLASLQTAHAIALARQGQTEEARTELQPALELHAQLARDGDDPLQRLSYAQALYAQALTEPPDRRGAALGEARRWLEKLPATIRATRDAKTLEAWLNEG